MKLKDILVIPVSDFAEGKYTKQSEKINILSQNYGRIIK